jgi:uncharacterized membrane protein YgdD (TMEM256/DUF423 family)
MRRLILALTGLAGFLVVALGAFGAHGLEGRLAPEAEGWWETATLYGLVHVVSALFIATTPHAPLRAGAAFLAGVVLFSGALYAMALFSLTGGAPGWLGAIAPLGGGAFLIGWALIIIHALRRR